MRLLITEKKPTTYSWEKQKEKEKEKKMQPIIPEKKKNSPAN